MRETDDVYLNRVIRILIPYPYAYTEYQLDIQDLTDLYGSNTQSRRMYSHLPEVCRFLGNNPDLAKISKYLYDLFLAPNILLALYLGLPDSFIELPNSLEHDYNHLYLQTEEYLKSIDYLNNIQLVKLILLNQLLNSTDS